MWEDITLNLMNLNEILDRSSRAKLLNVRDSALKKFKAKYNINDQEIELAKSQLFQDLKTDSGPNYSDSKIVSAYIQYYHLQHFGMSYQIFSKVVNLIRSLKSEHLYVCDVGAGTGAAFFGLKSVLRGETDRFQVSFDVVEPSHPMYTALKLISKEYTKEFKPLSFDFSYIKPEDDQSISTKILRQQIKIVTAFHLALPYKITSNTPNKSIKMLESVLMQIKPNICLFTVNQKKVDVLKRTVQGYLKNSKFKTGSCKVPSINSGNFKTPTDSMFVWGISDQLVKTR